MPGKKLVIAGQFGDGVNLRKVAQKAGIEMKVLEHPGDQHKRILDEKEAKYQLGIDKREKVKTSVGIAINLLIPAVVALTLLYPQAIFLLIILMIVTVAYSKQ